MEGPEEEGKKAKLEDADQTEVNPRSDSVGRVRPYQQHGEGIDGLTLEWPAVPMLLLLFT